MKENTIITISRQYGSGGAEIGEKLAKELNVPFYDRNIITMAAEKSGFSEDLFDKLDKRATNSFLYSLTMFGSTGVNGMTLTDQLFLTQCSIIKELAAKGSCVIVGRCADHVLREEKNLFNFFLNGKLEERIQRAAQEYCIKDRAEEVVAKFDKQRATYYNYYTGKRWGNAENYDLCVNTCKLGVDNTVSLLKSFIYDIAKNGI